MQAAWRASRRRVSSSCRASIGPALETDEGLDEPEAREEPEAEGHERSYTGIDSGFPHIGTNPCTPAFIGVSSPEGNWTFGGFHQADPSLLGKNVLASGQKINLSLGNLIKWRRICERFIS